MNSCSSYYFQLLHLAGFFAVIILAFLAVVFGAVVIGKLTNNNDKEKE